jgi:uncharacterized protein involved in exopolysaccharide biosynthesis
MDLRFYLSIFLRRLPWFVLMLALGSAAGFTLARVLPTVYAAQARLVVESEQIPDSLAASTVQIPPTEQLQIIQQRILSRDRLIEMANRLQLYAPLPGQPPRRPPAGDEIVADLRQRIQIRVSGGGSGRGTAQAVLVSVGFEAPTAAMAAQVTNEVVTMILREDVGMRTAVARQTLDFFTQEVTRLDQELARKGAEILAFQQANSAALPDSLDFRRSQQSGTQERLVGLTRQEAELRERRAQVERMKAAAAAGTVPTGAPLTPEQRSLEAARKELRSALTVLAPTHPRIRVLEAQIAALEAQVAAQAAEAPEGAGTGAPAMSPFDLQLADIDAQLRFNADERARLEARLEQLAVTIDATPANAIALGTLERDFANLRAQYDETVAKKARAETGEVIEALAKGQRISVIEQAVAPRTPDRPNRPLIAAGGVGLGLGLGFAMVLLLELLHPGIRRPVEITNKLGIAPFATLPYIRTPGEQLRRRAIIGAALAVAVAGVPAGLWLIDRHYMPLDLLIEDILRRARLAGAPVLPAVLPAVG